MQKQVLYPKFISRLFATAIDLLVLSMVLNPVMNLIAKHIFMYVFSQYFTDYGVNINDQLSVMNSTKLPEFRTYLTPSNLCSYFGMLLVANMFFIGSYFVLCWRKFGTTLGKVIMRLRITDATDLKSKPTYMQAVKRFLAYSIFPFSIPSMIFKKNRQALHDKIAATIVIKI